ncbi:MAG TPA: N-6 DNA methylase [Candidatus Lokiarchaeia archaeon]|nr:N-6 DNA methylase [Candidatus Lokiarchaeia archaeon]
MDQSLFGEQISVIPEYYSDIRELIDFLRAEITRNDDIRHLFFIWKKVGYRISDEEYVSSKQQIRKENPDDRVYAQVYSIEAVLSLILRMVAVKKLAAGRSARKFEDIYASSITMRSSVFSFLFEEDVYDVWKLIENSEESKRIEAELLPKLNQLVDSLSSLPPDLVFLVLHQKILNIESRKLLGEFYTPTELSEIIIQKGIQHLKDEPTRIIDLSCGAGSLLVSYLKNKHDVEGSNEIMNVIGIDINPLARIMAKFTLGFFQRDRGLEVQDPLVFCSDSLITYASWKSKLKKTKDQPDLLSFLQSKDDRSSTTLERSQAEITVDFLGELYDLQVPASVDAELNVTRTLVAAEMEKSMNGEPSSITIPGELKMLIQSSEIKSYLQALLVDKLCAHQAITRKYGFIVGNPPYLRVQSIQPLWKRTTLAGTYRSATGHFDLYYLFIELGIELLAKNGVLAYITSNKFITTSAGESIRQIISKTCSLIDLTDFSDSHVFDALILPVILVLRKSKVETGFLMTELKKVKTDAFEKHGLSDLVNLLIIDGSWEQKVWEIDEKSLVSINRHSNAQPRGKDDSWVFLDLASKELLALIKSRATATLKDISMKITVGIKTTANYAFIDDYTDEFINKPEIMEERARIQAKYGRDLFYPLIQGVDIRDFHFHDTNGNKGLNIFFPHYKDAENKFAAFAEDDMPVMLGYLKEKGYHESLKNREYVSDANRNWYEIWNPKDPDLMEQEFKIVVPDISPKNNFAIDHSGRYVDGSAYFVILKGQSLENYRYVLGILNSYVCEYFHKQNSGNNIYAGRYRYWSKSIKNLPVVRRSETTTELGDRLIAIVSELEQDYNQDMESEMNEVVFQIFGIEGDAKASITEWVQAKRKIGQRRE